MVRSLYYPSGYEVSRGQRVVQILHTAGLRAVYKLKTDEGFLAIKVCHHTDDLPMEQWDRHRKRLVHEYTVLRGLGSLPWFPVALDQAMHMGDALMLMELLEGQPFPRFLSSQPMLGQVLQSFLGVCQGVAVLHDQGIRHRDIKPGNFFRRSDGQGVLLDLGVCQTPMSEPITGADEFLGTSSYISLEYASDLRGNQHEKRRASPREDIYSLGVSFYELLVGRRLIQPPPEIRLEELLDMIITAEPPHPRDVHPDLKALGPLGDVAMKWMHKDPRERPAMGLDAVTMLSEAIVATKGALDVPLPPRSVNSNVVPIRSSRRVFPVPARLSGEATVNPPPPVPHPVIIRRPPTIRTSLAVLAAAMVVLATSQVVSSLKDVGFLSSRASTEVAPSNGQPKSNEPAEAKESDKPPPPTRDQKRPPCEPVYEVEMGGGCWQPRDSKRCSDEDAFKLEGVCYVPVRPKPSPPSSTKP